MESDAFAGVCLYDLANRQTRLQGVCRTARADHHARRSTGARFWSCHCLARAPEWACRPHVVCRQLARAGELPPPKAAAVQRTIRPNQPARRDQVRQLHGHRSRTVDTTASGRQISRPVHAASNPGPAMPRLTGRLGAGAWTMQSQQVQVIFGRM